LPKTGVEPAHLTAPPPDLRIRYVSTYYKKSPVKPSFL
jgi:hypothetical protein